jgi:hypothetical protein
MTEPNETPTPSHPTPWAFVPPHHEEYTSLGTLVDANGSIIRQHISPSEARKLIAENNLHALFAATELAPATATAEVEALRSTLPTVAM